MRNTNLMAVLHTGGLPPQANGRCINDRHNRSVACKHPELALDAARQRSCILASNMPTQSTRVVQEVVTAPDASRSILVCSVSGIEPHPIEPQREELPNDRAQGPPSRQQKLNEGLRVHCLRADT